jgi:hypothetical protein
VLLSAVLSKQRAKQEQLADTKAKQEQLADTKAKQEATPISDVVTQLDIMQEQTPIMDTATDIMQEQTPIMDTATLTQTITIQEQITKPTPQPKPKPPVKPPRFQFDEDSKKIKAKKIAKKLKQGYDYVVRQGKKYIKGNRVPLPKNMAMNKLMQAQDTTTARSGYIKKSGKTRKKDVPINKNLLKKFRRGKRNPNLIVEKSKYAIDTPGEKRGIPYKAAKLRKVGGKIKWL